ncbi:MAG: hypothetical protein M5U34_19365 [Chloroflexi bacterium]|nr:hypothetical protein [Chloroflexota bacterium]
MNRTKGILAAGSLTGLVLLTMLALGFNRIGAGGEGAGETAVSEPTTLIIQEPPLEPDASQAVQAWQTYGRDLETAVQTMQGREAQYQAEIEAANQTILQLQEQVNAANGALSASTSTYYEDDDDHDGDDHDDHDDYDDDDHDEHDDDHDDDDHDEHEGEEHDD